MNKINHKIKFHHTKFSLMKFLYGQIAVNRVIMKSVIK